LAPHHGSHFCAARVHSAAPAHL